MLLVPKTHSKNVHSANCKTVENTVNQGCSISVYSPVKDVHPSI